MDSCCIAVWGCTYSDTWWLLYLWETRLQSYLHAGTHIHVHTHTHTHTCTCTQTQIQHTPTDTHTHTHILVYILSNVDPPLLFFTTYTSTDTHTHTHVCNTHTFGHMHTYTYPNGILTLHSPPNTLVMLVGKISN